LRERFLAEGRILAQLRHPNLVPVTNVIQSGEHVGLVMDFLDGRPLSSLVRQGALAPARAVRLASEVADGMHHVHEAGIVHRDLKPDNVLVVGRDGDERAVVIDFGIAKVLEESVVDAGESEPTKLAVRLGTPRYMSPEQVEAAHAVDRRSDVFALGA